MSAITGSRLKSSLTDHPKLNPDNWLSSRDKNLVVGVSDHGQWVETIVWDETDRTRHFSVLIIDRTTGAHGFAADEFYTNALAAAKAQVGMP